MYYFDNKKARRTLSVVGFSDAFRDMLIKFLSADFDIVTDEPYLLVCEDGKLPKNHLAGKVIIIGDSKKSPKPKTVYLPRPVDLSALRSLALSMAESDSSGTSAAEYVVDPLSRSVSLGGSSVTLTTHEFRLFMLLSSRIGETVPREDIRKTLQNGESGSNMPDVYICYLRKKLEKIAGRGALVSVRGKGYILTNPK